MSKVILGFVVVLALSTFICVAAAANFKPISHAHRSAALELFTGSFSRPQDFPSALILQPMIGDWHYLYCYIPLDVKANSKASLRILDFIDPPPVDPSFEMLSSCGGLILYACWRINAYCVFNPITNQSTTLPNPSNMYPRDICLAFDHSISPHYKVINVGCVHIEIYSSETNSWRRSQAQYPEPFKVYWNCGAGVSFNGAIFWTSESSIYYFDIDREILHSHPMPKMGVQHQFGCVHEHLYLVASCDKPYKDQYKLNIFELGNDYSSWSLKYCIDLFHVARDTYRCPKDIAFSLSFRNVLSFVAREGNQEPYLVVYIRDRVILVNLKDKTCRKLCRLPELVDAEKISWLCKKVALI